MILIDYREKPDRSGAELIPLIRRIGGKADEMKLRAADAAFEGYSPTGDGSSIMVGIERKRLRDILMCIDDSRLTGKQLVEMRQVYSINVLMVEGMWRPHDPNGTLVEGFSGGSSWGELKMPGGKRVLYSKLRRFLFSVQLSGIPVIYTRDIFQSAYDMNELYQYCQKKDHTSHLGKQKLQIPYLAGRPPLVRRWAEELTGVGPKIANEAAAFFKRPDVMANAELDEWLAVPGVGPKLASDVVAEIAGVRRRR